MLALVTLLTFAIGVGLSLLAAYLLRPKIKTQDFPQTALALRGSYVPWIMGRTRVKPVFGWAGHRFRRRERAHAGKGGSFFAPKVKIFYEEGWHILSLGPVTALYGIYDGQNALFEGTLTPESFPSGSLLDLGKQGQARIYWGELDQPVNTVLGDSSRVGVSSRWPGICYIHWEEKRLGQSPIWPNLEYWIERRPTGNYLSQSEPWRDPTFTLGTAQRTVFESHAGAEGFGYIEVYNVDHNEFQAEGKFHIEGAQGLADGDYMLVKVEEFTSSNRIWAKLYPEGGVPSSHYPESGHATAYSRGEDMGANPAHVIAALLFESWPYGLSQKQEYWDMESLEELGQLMESEDWWTSWRASDGKTAKDLLGMVMQDIGLLIYQNPNNGKLTFAPVREVSGTLFELSQDNILPPAPEISSVMDSVKSNRVVFAFNDVNLGYRQATIAIDDDGQASFENYFNAQQSRIEIADHFDMAAKIAERRSQEELGNGAALRLNADRSARGLVPGQAITIEDMEEVYRVSSVGLEADSGVVKLELIADFYGAKASSFLNRPGKTVWNPDPSQNNPLETFLEVPEYLVGKVSRPAIIAPIVRHDEHIFDEMLYLSQSGTSYNLYGNQDASAAGGTLIDALPAGGEFIINEGPTFTAVGPDMAEVLDLSGSPELWRRGRQLCVIGEEIFFLQKVTALGGDTYRLDGLIRARYDTHQEAHAAGDGLFIFQDTTFDLIQDLLVESGKDLYMKAQPLGWGGEVPLDLLEVVHKTLYGKGVVPMPPEGLSVSSPYRQVPVYVSGSDVSVKWLYRSTVAVGTGAGMQGYGEVAGASPVDGEFRLEILDSSDVVQREVKSLSSPEYTYTNAAMLSDFGSEPASFKIKVYAVRGGKQSSPATLSISKL